MEVERLFCLWYAVDALPSDVDDWLLSNDQDVTPPIQCVFGVIVLAGYHRSLVVGWLFNLPYNKRTAHHTHHTHTIFIYTHTHTYLLTGNGYTFFSFNGSVFLLYNLNSLDWWNDFGRAADTVVPTKCICGHIEVYKLVVIRIGLRNRSSPYHVNPYK